MTSCEEYTKIKAMIIYSSCTGYYNPEEDIRNGEVSEVTGLWYIDV